MKLHFPTMVSKVRSGELDVIRILMELLLLKVRKDIVLEKTDQKNLLKKLNKILEADKKYGQNRTLSQDKKVKKLYKQYDQSLSKDIKKAMELGDEKAYNNMVSGRTYLKMIMDSNFLSMAVNDAAVRANAPLGKELTYNVLRDKDLGTVKVTVNGVSSDYVYMPEFKNNKSSK